MFAFSRYGSADELIDVHSADICHSVFFTVLNDTVSTYVIFLFGNFFGFFVSADDYGVGCAVIFTGKGDVLVVRCRTVFTHFISRVGSRYVSDESQFFVVKFYVKISRVVTYRQRKSGKFGRLIGGQGTGKAYAVVIDIGYVTVNLYDVRRLAFFVSA